MPACIQHRGISLMPRLCRPATMAVTGRRGSDAAIRAQDDRADSCGGSDGGHDRRGAPVGGCRHYLDRERERHAQVTWTLAPGWLPNVIYIAKSPAIGSDGSFFSENIVDAGILSEGQTSFLSSSQLNYGTYYVRVQAYASDFSAIEWSETATRSHFSLLDSNRL